MFSTVLGNVVIRVAEVMHTLQNSMAVARTTMTNPIIAQAIESRDADEDTQPISAALATNNSASSSMKFTQMGKENMTCSQ